MAIHERAAAIGVLVCRDCRVELRDTSCSPFITPLPARSRAQEPRRQHAGQQLHLPRQLLRCALCLTASGLHGSCHGSLPLRAAIIALVACC